MDKLDEKDGGGGQWEYNVTHLEDTVIITHFQLYALKDFVQNESRDYLKLPPICHLCDAPRFSMFLHMVLLPSFLHYLRTH